MPLRSMSCMRLTSGPPNVAVSAPTLPRPGSPEYFDKKGAYSKRGRRALLRDLSFE